MAATGSNSSPTGAMVASPTEVVDMGHVAANSLMEAMVGVNWEDTALSETHPTATLATEAVAPAMVATATLATVAAAPATVAMVALVEPEVTVVPATVEDMAGPAPATEQEAMVALATGLAMARAQAGTAVMVELAQEDTVALLVTVALLAMARAMDLEATVVGLAMEATVATTVSLGEERAAILMNKMSNTSSLCTSSCCVQG